MARNDPCSCGSGRKFKHCCAREGQSAPEAAALGKVPVPPSIGPVTEAGRLLAAFSPTQPMFRQRIAQPAASRTQAAQEFLHLAAGHEAAGRLAEAVLALQSAARMLPDDPVAQFNLGLLCLKAGRLAEAEASLRRAIARRPDFGRAHYNLAETLKQQGRDAEAMAAFRAAIAHGAKRMEAHAGLADLLHARGDAAGAAKHYRQAADATAKGRWNAAQALVVEHRYEEAAAVLRRALTLDPRHAPAHWSLGHVLTILGHLDEAIVELDRAIELAPRSTGAFYNRILARRVTEADRPLLARMAALGEAPLGEAAQKQLHFALGKAFDDLGEYATAIVHFDAANRIAKGLARLDRADLVAGIDRLIARFAPEYFRRHSALGSPDEAAVFVLGMPRSGTTLVEQILSSHPQVAAGGEMMFWMSRGPDWAKAADNAPDAAAIRGLADDYRAELRRIGPAAARIVDKMPHNFLWIGLIHLAFPRARIVHCRRNPVDTCLSIYFTHFLTRMDYASDRSDLVFEYRQYQRLMAHWRAILPPDRFLDLDYETLVADREQGTRRLVAFCGLEWDDACLRPEDNRRVVETASMWQARQPVYRSSVARWRNYEPWLGELRELLQPSA